MTRWIFRIVAIALLSAGGATAQAETTLTYEWTDISCGVIAADGSRSAQPCATTSFGALINPGESVYVSANLSYAYHDDGLALPQTVAFTPRPPLPWIVLDHEGALVFFNSSTCSDLRSCEARAFDHVDNFTGAYPLVLGNNLVPDDLSGKQYVFASSGVPLSYPFGPLQRGVSFDVYRADTYSGIAPPVPEPASYALMLAGLAAVGAAARRRRRG